MKRCLECGATFRNEYFATAEYQLGMHKMLAHPIPQKLDREYTKDEILEILYKANEK